MQLKRIAIPAAIVLIIVGLYFGGLKDYISLHGLKDNSYYFKLKVEDNYWFSALIFTALYTAVMAAGLPVVAPFSLLGGFLFNAIPGAIFSAIGGSVGSVLYVVLFRHFFAESMYEKFKPQLMRFQENMRLYGKRYILILHFTCLVPFLMINTMDALAGLSLWDVFWTTIVGSGPIFLFFAYEGRQLANIESVRDIFSLNFILALAFLVVLASTPIIIKRFRGSSLDV